MTYDEFKQEWIRAQMESGLPHLGLDHGTETLDLRSMDRVFESGVEPIGGQDAEPFHVTARLAWRWHALDTARSATSEEDMLVELFDREPARKARTRRSTLRIDVVLRASLMDGRDVTMPGQAAWTEWAGEVHERLERIEPLLPEPSVRERRDGLFEILAWRGDPVAHVICSPDGELRLERVELAAWQGVELPRHWSDTDRRPDKHPAGALRDLFARVRAALHAWMQSVDRLLPRDPV